MQGPKFFCASGLSFQMHVLYFREFFVGAEETSEPLTYIFPGTNEYYAAVQKGRGSETVSDQSSKYALQSIYVNIH